MSKITKSYETKLETAQDENIVAILDAKLEATSPNSVTDYVALALDNVDSAIDRMKESKKILDDMIKQAESQKTIIKNGVSEWLSDGGIDYLDGDIVSSMKIVSPKAKNILKVTNEETLINLGYFKTVLDKTAVKQAILDGVEIEGAEIEVEHQSDSLTVYKRRK